MVELKCDASEDSADPVTLAQAAYDVCAGLGERVIFVGFDWRALLPLIVRGASCWFTTDRLSGDARPVIDAIANAGGQGWFPQLRAMRRPTMSRMRDPRGSRLAPGPSTIPPT